MEAARERGDSGGERERGDPRAARNGGDSEGVEISETPSLWGDPKTKRVEPQGLGWKGETWRG